VPERPPLEEPTGKVIFLPCGRSSTQLMRDSLGSVFRSFLVLIVDVLFAIPRVAFKLSVYFWMRVSTATDPELARRRAIFWTWITFLGVAAIAVLWMVLANAVHW
jgi:hypothetical protein